MNSINICFYEHYKLPRSGKSLYLRFEGSYDTVGALFSLHKCHVAGTDHEYPELYFPTEDEKLAMQSSADETYLNIVKAGLEV